MQNPKFAIVVSKFNAEITNQLYKSAHDFLIEKGLHEDDIALYEAPGAFELPLIAKTLAKTGRYNGVICLGCVIKGETAHFEYISLCTSMGLMQSMLETETPIAFGVLTSYGKDQAIPRQYKGRDAAAACWETAKILGDILQQ